MQVHIETDDERLRERTTRMVDYVLNRYREQVTTMRLDIAPARDRLGTSLSRCRASTVMKRHGLIEIDEIQSNSELAVTRALERTIRTIQRRLDPEIRQRNST